MSYFLRSSYGGSGGCALGYKILSRVDYYFLYGYIIMGEGGEGFVLSGMSY